MSTSKAISIFSKNIEPKFGLNLRGQGFKRTILTKSFVENTVFIPMPKNCWECPNADVSTFRFLHC